MADVGFIGFGQARALELPEGDQAPVAPEGRGRIRYDRGSGQIQASFDRGSYEAFGAAGGGGTTVADTTELAALDDTTFVNGVNVAVASVRDVFELDEASAVAADGITVVATASGTGRWVRRMLPSAVWARQATWYIDPVSGSDEADGATVASALATFSEFARRIGDMDTPARIDVNLLGDLQDTFVFPTGRHRGGIWLVGQETSVLSATVSSGAPLDTTTTPVTPGMITAVGEDFTGLEGQLVRVSSGAAQGSAARILQVAPAGAGVDTVRVSEWYSLQTFAPTPGPAGGDAVDVVSQTTITTPDPFTPIEFFARDRGSGTFLALQNLDIVGDAPIRQSSGWVALFQCRLHSVDDDHMAPITGGTVECYGCLLDGFRLVIDEGSTCVLYSSALRDSDIVLNNGLLDCTDNTVAQFVAGGDGAARPAVFVGARGIVETASAGPRGGGLGAFDLPGAGAALLGIESGGLLNTQGGRYWTHNQAAATNGIVVQPAGVVTWPAGTTAVAAFDLDPGGSGNEIDLGGTTTDAATLGASGVVTAANNAMAVPRSA